jgi:exonuclease SbcC
MIQEVSMTNWRAFDQCSFQFKPGLNFIMGPNGKGKTSILEAIVYGLTGEPSVVEDRNQLLRDPSKPATIIITFRVDSTDFRIERTQQPGKAGDASIWDLDANRRIAAYHKNVTEEVGRLIGVSADFLRRIVYMAEGDVFRFLQDPPGKAMNEQVQRVLGLTQLDQFRDAIRLSQRDLREDSKSLKSLRRRMLDFNLWMEQDLEIKLGELDSKRELHMEEIYDTQEQLAKLQEQYQSLNSLGSQILDRIGFLRANAERWERIDERPLIMYFDELQEEISKSREQNVELEKALARLNGQQDVHTRVLELLSGTKNGSR